MMFINVSFHILSRLVVLLIACVIVFSPLSAYALSIGEDGIEQGICPPDMSVYDCEALIGGWENYIPDEAVSSDCSDGSSSFGGGSQQENGQYIFTFLTAKSRLKPFQAAGVIGNIVIESGINPLQLQNTKVGVNTKAKEVKKNHPNSGWGIVQWTPATKFINEVGLNKADSLSVQTSFLWDQLEGRTKIPEKTAGDQIKRTGSIEDAVLAFQGNSKLGGKYVGYERPADQSGSVKRRKQAAIAALAKFGSGKASDNLVLVCGQDDQKFGGYSLPVDQKFFDQNPEWFSKPHHDYPASDIPIGIGTKVYSITAGRVIKAPINNKHASYGAGVEIDAGGGVIIIYGHGYDGGSIPGARVGDTVRPGQLIMHSGSDGNSSGPHLHVEIRLKKRVVCPQGLLTAIGKKKNSIPTISSLPSGGCTK